MHAFPPLNEQEVELAATSLPPYPQALHLLPAGQHKGRCLCPEDTIVPLGHICPLCLGRFHAKAGVYRLPCYVSSFHSHLGEHSKPLI